jgi:3-hydroxyisobutyrate dehydrogenase-like beta-hydroxyacid dehydrogenase
MSVHASGEHSHRPAAGRWFWIPLILGGVGAVCGIIGQHRYDVENDQTTDYWSVGYHTLQLFFLHAPHLDHPVPGFLNAGRWLVSLAVLLTVGYGIIRVFRSECRLILARWRTGHVVICGLGRLGSKLAEEFQRNGTAVIAIETFVPPESDAAGLAVIAGDACSPRDLRSAAVGRAKQVIAVCDDEQTNVAVAAAVGQLLASSNCRPPTLKPLECWIFVADSQLRQTFQQEPIFPHAGTNYHVNVRGLDLFELAARQVFSRSPLDFERIQPTASTVVHLVIVGFGPMGQNLALQAAKIGHFANFKKIKLTVIVDRATNPTLPEFQKQYPHLPPKLAEICDLNVVGLSLQDADWRTKLTSLLSQDLVAKELTTFAFCWDTSSESATGEREMFQRLERDDATNLRLALDLSKGTLPGNPQFLVYQTRKHGFGALFPLEGRAAAIGARMHAFGLVEEMYTLETLLHERDDAIATALHQIWYENQIKQGNAPGSKPALFSWDELPDRFKDSNRQAADHIAVKLRALGYRVDRLRGDQPRVTKLDQKDQVDLLGKMEHQRWCAEKLLQGYVYGERRDDVAKIQPYLVPWEKLTVDVMDYDRQQVRGIPDALIRAGFGIYPQVQ